MKGVYYNSPTLGPLNKEEYANLLRELPNSSDVPIVEWYGFKYNVNGICLNPNKEKIEAGKLYCELRTAQNRNGAWCFAIDLFMGGSSHSYGVSCRDKGFETEKEAKYALLCYAERKIRNRMKDERDMDVEEEDGCEYGAKKLKENRLKNLKKFLDAILYFQDVHNNLTLF